MYTEHEQGLAGVQPDDLLAALSVRPTTWLHPFLQLAAARADPSAGRRSGTGPARHWYRLALPGPDRRCRFIWHPAGHPALFSGLTGAFTVGPIEDGCVLGLGGEAIGGSRAVNEAAIGALVDLLAVALAEAQSGG